MAPACSRRSSPHVWVRRLSITAPASRRAPGQRLDLRLVRTGAEHRVRAEPLTGQVVELPGEILPLYRQRDHAVAPAQRARGRDDLPETVFRAEQKRDPLALGAGRFSLLFEDRDDALESDREAARRDVVPGEPADQPVVAAAAGDR